MSLPCQLPLFHLKSLVRCLITVSFLAWGATAIADSAVPETSDSGEALPTPEVTAQDHGAAEPSAIPDSKLLDLARQLADPNFEQRIQAERQFAEIARERPRELATMARDAAPEIATRLVRILEKVFQRQADEIADQAERELESLAQSDGPAAAPATQVLLGNARLRESRARDALEKLGGELGYTHPNSDRIRRGHAIAPLTGVGFGEPAVLYGVWLHGDWKGTQKDLWHIRRLAHWPDLTIYSIKGNGIELEDLLRLAATVPGLTIEERGPCLGITSSHDINTCYVGNVLANSAADEAGLKVNDEIVQLDDQPVRNFGHLVELLQDFKVGDEITLHVIRNAAEVPLKVKLGSWRGVAHRHDTYVPAPSPFLGPFGSDDSPIRPAPVPLPETEPFSEKNTPAR